MNRDGGELWLDPGEVVWFAPEPGGHPPYLAALSKVVSAVVPDQPLLAGAGAAGIALPERVLSPRPGARGRAPSWSARRKRRFATRFVPAVVVAVSATVTVTWVVQRPAPSPAAPTAAPRLSDAIPEPAVSVRVPPPLARATEREAVPPAASARSPRAGRSKRAEPAYPEIRWRRSTAVGLPHAGQLLDGVQLPVEGPDWVTWDPERHRLPNRTSRLYGTDELVRVVLKVAKQYGEAHPRAPRVVVGDLSHRSGGEIGEHVSHENGLDVDVYYPRSDRRLTAPRRLDQIDMRLAQDLVDRFVRAGATFVFVGYGMRLHGPAGIVVPYANHENHMHVRIPPRRGAS